VSEPQPGATPPVRAPARLGAAVKLGVLGSAGLGALLLVLAEFTTLFTIHIASRRAALSSVATGSHDSYALLPIAALVFLLAVGVWRTGSRTALSAVAALGIAALLFGLIGDLPDAEKHGVLKLGAAHVQLASASPSAGLYLETLGAVVLIITGILGLLLTRPAARPDGPTPHSRRRRPVRA
jgi:hypothetical protein